MPARVRRSFLKFVGSLATVAAAGAAGLLRTAESWAANWNKAGFESKALAEVLKSLGAANPEESRDIAITAPDIAENSALVPVAVTSKIPNTQQISIVAEKNPFPLVATFEMTNGAEGYVRTDLKMGQTSDVWAVVKADGKFYVARTEVKITVGGCG
jgi:sulfur-oxidizing protein SoxY